MTPAAVLNFLADNDAVRSGGVGAVGFCMGGRYVMGAAGTYPDRIIASASLHGTTLMSDRSDSPHLLARNLRGEFYCGFAERDSHAPLTMVQELEKLLKSCDVRYRHNVHAGTEHGYSLPDRDVSRQARHGARLGKYFRHVPPRDPALPGVMCARFASTQYSHSDRCWVANPVRSRVGRVVLWPDATSYLVRQKFFGTLNDFRRRVENLFRKRLQLFSRAGLDIHSGLFRLGYCFGIV